jgi:hypothetical protein
MIDYRGALRHVDVRPWMTTKEITSKESRRHVSRHVSRLSSSQHLSASSASYGTPTELMNWSKKTPRRCSPEIQRRMDLRPLLRHACGHEERIVTIGVQDGDENEETWFGETPDGTLVMVGPQLSEDVGGRELVIPFECSECDRSGGNTHQAEERHVSEVVDIETTEGEEPEARIDQEPLESVHEAYHPEQIHQLPHYDYDTVVSDLNQILARHNSNLHSLDENLRQMLSSVHFARALATTLSLFEVQNSIADHTCSEADSTGTQGMRPSPRMVHPSELKSPVSRYAFPPHPF